MKTISVITVCRNSEQTIQDTLISVDQQSYSGIEHVVVDGFSTDKTWDIISEFSKRASKTLKLIREKDAGIYDAMNKGILYSSGDIIGFLNSDDVFADPKAVNWIAEAFEDPSTEMVYGDLVYTKVHDLNHITRRWQLGSIPSSGLKTGWHPAHPTMYVRRALLMQKQFDLNYKIAADYEMMVRLIEKQKIHSKYIPQTMVKMREGGASNQSFGNILKANWECYQAWVRNDLSASPAPIFLKLIRKVIQFAQTRLA